MTWLASLDFETTGLDGPEPVSVAIIRTEKGHAPVKVLSMLIKPTKPIEAKAQSIHGITAEMVADARPWPDAAADIVAALDGCDAIVCHNSPFDMPILLDGCERAGIVLPDLRVLCTLVLARELWGMFGNTLVEVAGRLNVSLVNAHNAEADATAAALILRPLLRLIAGDEPVPSLDALAIWTAEKGAEHEAFMCERFRKRNTNTWGRITAPREHLTAAK